MNFRFNQNVKLLRLAITFSVGLFSCRHDIPETQTMTFNGATENAIDQDLKLSADSVLFWLESVQLPNGLLETSYQSNLVSLYDNALAALAFTNAGQYQNAAMILSYYNSRLQTEMLVGTGGYFQFRNAIGQPQGNRWLGDNAWLLIAIQNYTYKTNDTQYDALQEALTNWIVSQQDIDGGVWGGTDANGNTISKVTEANIDAFNAVPGYTSFHENILNYLEIDRWNTSEQLLVSWPGSNYYYALDNFSWGFCTFENFPLHTLDSADRFLNTQLHVQSGNTITGYCFDEDLDVVWIEGSAQMAVAFAKAGRYDEANQVLHELHKTRTIQAPFTGAIGLPYASNVATHYGNSPLWIGADADPTTASSAWYFMACRDFDPMELNYHKSIPLSHRFW
jgi:cellulose synthase operon protein B